MAKKPKPKNKQPSKRYKHYKVQGERLIRDKTCPRCGTNFLAEHKDRFYCGGCHYVEYKEKEAKK